MMVNGIRIEYYVSFIAASDAVLPFRFSHRCEVCVLAVITIRSDQIVTYSKNELDL